jgi:iron complex outermembrane receptor protein
VLLNASWFRIQKSNVLRLDPAFGPNGNNFAAVFPIGRVRNQGVELDVTGRVTKDLSVVLNYALLDSEILADPLYARGSRAGAAERGAAFGRGFSALRRGADGDGDPHWQRVPGAAV